MAVEQQRIFAEKDFKARHWEGRIVAVGVDLFGPDCVACQPAYRFRAEDFSAWLTAIADFVQRGDVRVYAENAFNALQGRLPLYPLELHGRLCNEIDDLQEDDGQWGTGF